MRTPDDYAKDWNIKDQSADSRDNASGAGTEGTDNEHAGIPFSWDMPPSPRWGMATDKKNDGGYGHAAEIENVNLAKDKDMLRDGYESVEDGKSLDSWHLNDPKAKGEFGYTQDANPKNPWNRGDDIHRNDVTSPGSHADVGTGRDGKSRENPQG